MANSKSEENTSILIAIPNIDHYEKTYGSLIKSDEKKALRLFKDFESKEKFIRLRNELIAVKEERVSEKVCDQVIGKSRAGKFGTYSNWAQIMLLKMSELK